MKHNRMHLLLILLVIAGAVVVACTNRPGGEPSAADLPTATAEPDEAVSSDDPTATPEPVPTHDGEMIVEEAIITDVQVMLLESWPLQATVQIDGELGNGCAELDEIQTEREGNTFLITVKTMQPAGAVCTQQLRFFSENVSLDIAGLPAGTYTVDVNGVQEQFTLDQDNVAQPDPGEDGGADLGQEDQATLIRLTLERALIDQEIPDFALLADQGKVVLSSENINTGLVPDLAGIDLIVMTPAAIQQKANEEGDFLHLRFDEISATSAGEATVRLSNAWAIAADSDTAYLSGGGFAIEYTRDGDSWSGEVSEAWIS